MSVGLLCFASVKLAGYVFAGAYFRRQFGTPRPHPVIFGLVRTLVGAAAGTGAALLVSELARERTGLFFALLAPIRFVEWYIVLSLFFGGPQASRGLDVDSTLRFNVEAVARQEHFLAFSALGVLWSYLLDLPGLLPGLGLPAGVWIS